jgi:uncharacterized membrane protein
MSQTKRALGGPRGILINESIAIRRPAGELYRFWRNLQNLPRFMEHLQSVEVLDDRRSRWIARGPAGATVEWVAEIINEQQDKVIAWRSLPGSDVVSAGSVWFRPGLDGRSTAVHVRLQYSPPLGRLGDAVARLLGETPQLQIRDDLRRLKQLVEDMAIATVPSDPAAFARLRSPFIPPGDLNSE